MFIRGRRVTQKIFLLVCLKSDVAFVMGLNLSEGVCWAKKLRYTFAECKHYISCHFSEDYSGPDRGASGRHLRLKISPPEAEAEGIQKFLTSKSLLTIRDVEAEAEARGASGGEACFGSLEAKARASKIRLRLQNAF